MQRALVVIPTYNEAQNVSRIAADLLALPHQVELLFVDDSSPDGTAKVIQELIATQSRVHLLLRPSKAGIGSAHRDGILWAYMNGYEEVATMDADLTHSPADLGRVLSFPDDADVVVASRFLSPGSLPGWRLWRKFLTHLGHLLTRFALGLPYDSTGALRRYRIKNIPQRIFQLAESNGYSYIFEVLLLLHVNGLSIKEVPVILPARILGSSKMSLREIGNSVRLIFFYFLVLMLLPERVRIVAPIPPMASQTSGNEGAAWDNYWGRRFSIVSLIYDVLASIYRKLVIRPALEWSIRRTFKKGAKLLHAGCGSGQVDERLAAEYRITALDYSARALELYLATNGTLSEVVHGSILKLPFPDESFDGIYNLGVMEHFPEDLLKVSFREFRRVLKPDGKIVIWWPPEFGSTVQILKIATIILSVRHRHKEKALFPEECSRIKSKKQINGLLSECGLVLESYDFGPRDLYTQVALTARKD